MSRRRVNSVPSPLTAAWKQRLRRRVLTWYAKHARDLPWRQSRDPYQVWVSEIMLQQTLVETVARHFGPFLERFPNVAALAAADEQQVLRQWEGLGYYRRARQMHAAARLLVTDYEGQFPCDVTTLQQLPGVGRYTAGAIASIAFGKRAPILEANTIRLLSRLIGYREDPQRSAGQRQLWETAAAILPRCDLAQFNEGLMELGEQVCRLRQPQCRSCPVAAICVAQQEGLQEQIPVRAERVAAEDLHEVAIVVSRKRQVLLRQCGPDEWWTGLWDFPRFSVDAENGQRASQEMVAKVCQLTGVTCALTRPFKTIKHAVTRYRITLDCYQANYISGRVRRSRNTPVRWVDLDDLADYPLSTTGRKIARVVNG